MTTRINNSGRSEGASNVSQDDIVSESIAVTIADALCNADGMPYELTNHYLIYGPALPSEVNQARYRADSRDHARAYVMIDYQLI